MLPKRDRHDTKYTRFLRTFSFFAWHFCIGVIFISFFFFAFHVPMSDLRSCFLILSFLL